MADLASRITKLDEAPAASENDGKGKVQAEESTALAHKKVKDETDESTALAQETVKDETDEGTALARETVQDEAGVGGQLDGADEDSALVVPTYDIEVQLAVTDGPVDQLYSAKTFEDLKLDDNIMQGLHAMNFKKPSKIQERALPLMLRNPPMHLIAQSQSGTGKTAAFSLAILNRIDTNKRDQPQALVLAPSRELVRQIQGVIQAIGQFVPGLVVEAAIPGAISRETGIRANVVVGTPGTVMDSIRRRSFDASQIRVLVVDEADNMLDHQGLGDQCIRTKGMLPRNMQILLFSATYPGKVMVFAEKFAPKAAQMKLRPNEQTVKGISQMYMDCPTSQDKYDILCKLYGLMTVGSSVIFVRTRESADEIKRRMEADGHKVSALHGAYDGANRDQVLDDFRLGNSKVLITTNVLARGIDVSSVSMVINYDVPLTGPPRNLPDPETYYHRIGRTGRFGRVGVSITFVADQRDFEALRYIADYYGLDLKLLNPNDWDDTEKKVKEVIKSSRARPDYAPGEGGS